MTPGATNCKPTTMREGRPGLTPSSNQGACTTCNRVRALRYSLWRHPEWWAILISFACWSYLFLVRGTAAAHNHQQPAPAWDLSAYLHWLAMIPAMMFPFLIGHLRTAATRSFWDRRNRAIALFLVAYAAVWACFGLVAAGTARWLPVGAWPIVAAAWHLTPAKRLAMIACHRTIPLAPCGWQADRDCLTYGWSHGTACLRSCWAQMIACVALHAFWWGMPFFTLLLWMERSARHGAEPLNRIAALTLIPAAFCLFT